MKNEATLVILIISLAGAMFYLSQEKEMMGIKTHYYKDGVEVFPQEGFSIVTPPGGSYDQISFDISATNQDVPITDIQIIDASPQAFKDALPTTTQSLESQETKILWTSGLIDTSQFEGQTINFWVDISGIETYTDTTFFPDRTYSGSITFEAEELNPVDHITVARDDTTCEGKTDYIWDKNTRITSNYVGRCYNPSTGDYMVVYRDETTCDGKPGYQWDKNIYLGTGEKIERCYNPSTGDYLSVNYNDYDCDGKPGYQWEKTIDEINHFGRCLKGDPSLLSYPAYNLFICCEDIIGQRSRRGFIKTTDISLPLSTAPTEPYTSQGLEIYENNQVIIRVPWKYQQGVHSSGDELMYLGNGYDNDGSWSSGDGLCTGYGGFLLEDLTPISDSQCYLYRPSI